MTVRGQTINIFDVGDLDSIADEDLPDLPEIIAMLVNHIKQMESTAFDNGLLKGTMLGMRMGMAGLLRRQLTRRFRPLPARIDEQIERARPTELEQWSEQVLDAKTLDAVFA